MDAGSALIVALGAVGGASGVAAVIKAISERKVGPRSVANEETKTALEAQGEAIANLRTELASVRADHRAEMTELRTEHRRALEQKEAEINRLRERITQLETRRSNE